jgi:hypothetical protein
MTAKAKTPKDPTPGTDVPFSCCPGLVSHRAHCACALVGARRLATIAVIQTTARSTDRCIQLLHMAVLHIEMLRDIGDELLWHAIDAADAA